MLLSTQLFSYKKVLSMDAVILPGRKEVKHRYVRTRTRRSRILRFRLVLSIVAIAIAACGNSSSQSTRAADRLVNEGLRASQQGRLAEAIKDFQAAIKQNPLDAYAYYDLGVVFQQENDNSDAATEYRKALLVNPSYKSALFNLAVLETSTSPADAVLDYQRLNTIDPNDPNVLLNLGLLLRQMGNSTQGNVYIERAIELNPAYASRVPPTSALRISPPATRTPAPTTTTPIAP
jgi:tetratricopeptide (TPR) repeat protein